MRLRLVSLNILCLEAFHPPLAFFCEPILALASPHPGQLFQIQIGFEVIWIVSEKDLFVRVLLLPPTLVRIALFALVALSVVHLYLCVGSVMFKPYQICSCVYVYVWYVFS